MAQVTGMTLYYLLEFFKFFLCLSAQYKGVEWNVLDRRMCLTRGLSIWLVWAVKTVVLRTDTVQNISL